jgi:hypothetical protein
MTEKIYTIGRDPDNNARIDKPEVSRYHARIIVRNDLVTIEDLDSTNGTYVNGFRIKEVYLNCRDKVEISKKYPIKDEFMAKLFKDISPEINPNDWSAEFLELKGIYHQFQKEKKRLISQHQLYQNLKRLALVTLPSVLFMIVSPCILPKGKSYFPVYVVLTAVLSAMTPFITSENKKLLKVDKEFRKVYRCPKCKMALTQDWDILREESVCPRCHAIWSD